MPKLEGFDKVAEELSGKSKQGQVGTVVVSFSAEYAIFVHENLEARHPIGQAKFLEQPAREMADELGKYIAKLVKGKVPLMQALYMAGLRLQKAAQKLCPVDTGYLRASANTRAVEE